MYTDRSQISIPKQLPRYGINILHAVAIGNSTDINVLMITSSIDIISATNHIINKSTEAHAHGIDLQTSHINQNAHINSLLPKIDFPH